jgi:hypothetical protein
MPINAKHLLQTEEDAVLPLPGKQPPGLQKSLPYPFLT